MTYALIMSLDSQIISCVCAIYVPSYSQVKRVYDVYRYIFSGEENMCCLTH
jgi:hypothetical protein